jgi:hypothetical protein
MVMTAISPMRATKVDTNALMRSLFEWSTVEEGDKGVIVLCYSEFQPEAGPEEEPTRVYNTALIDITTQTSNPSVMLQYVLEDGELVLRNRITGPTKGSPEETPLCLSIGFGLSLYNLSKTIRTG